MKQISLSDDHRLRNINFLSHSSIDRPLHVTGQHSPPLSHNFILSPTSLIATALTALTADNTSGDKPRCLARVGLDPDPPLTRYVFLD